MSLKRGAGVNHGFSHIGPGEFGPDFQMPSRSARPMYPSAGLTFGLLWQAKRARPRITRIPFYSIVSRGFTRLTFFYFFPLSKGMTLSFLGYVLSTKLRSHSVLSSITCTSVAGGIMMNRRQLW